jgi:hypothetical protein
MTLQRRDLWVIVYCMTVLDSRKLMTIKGYYTACFIISMLLVPEIYIFSAQQGANPLIQD